MSVAVDVRDLFRVHSTPEGDAAALQGLTLSIPEGEILTVLGPSGAGKTSFLRILVEKAAEGKLLLQQIVALFDHLSKSRPMAITRERIGDAVVALGLA